MIRQMMHCQWPANTGKQNINHIRSGLKLTFAGLLTALLLIAKTSFAAGPGEAADPFDFDLTESAEPTETNWQVNGYLEWRSRYALPQRDWLSNRMLTQLETRYESDEWLFFSSAQMEYDPATTDYRSAERFNLNEAYFSFDGDQFDLMIGKQRIAWGVADGRSTIDRVNAVDMREPIGNGRTSARRPSWAVFTEYNQDWGIWEAVWLPRGRDRKFAEFGSPWEMPFINQLRRQERDGQIALEIDDPHPHEGGIRFTHYGQGLDWGLAYFNGYTDAPIVLENKDNRIWLRPERIQTWNINLASGIGKNTLRAEFSHTPDFPTINGQTESLTQVVTGWDRTFLTDLYVNIQIYWDGYDETEDDYGLTFAITNGFYRDALELGIRGQTARDAQYVLEVFANYQVNDNLSLDIKSLTFGGDTDTGIGAFRDNDFVELAIRYAF
ncbi:hypothetical protein Q7C_378 [Methylophaga frappieri]|uniref:Alginate export domain-containing protein n=2 Tax=Methylophaga frappieri (strain ATCC BAA-2434 / DSM 25690 / JAM7) TaxID=754477 RepID=I1YF60_METFJ|nr:hypothetical protein Q7C_378 [Methylophaga frappieri]